MITTKKLPSILMLTVCVAAFSALHAQTADDSVATDGGSSDAAPTGVGTPLDTVEDPEANASDEFDASGDAPESEADAEGSGILGGIMGMFGGEGEGGADGKSERADEIRAEQDKRINELRRNAISDFSRKRLESAITHLNELISIKPYDSDYHLALGLNFRSRHQWPQAIGKYDDTLDLGGPKGLIALLKAEAMTSTGTREQVFEFLEEAAVNGRNIFNDAAALPALSAFRQDTEFIKLALSLEKVQVDVTNLKDPFTGVFQTLQAAQGDGTGDDEPITLDADEQEELLETAKKTFERVKFYIKLEDENKAMGSYVELKKMIEKKDLLTIPGIVREFEYLIGKMPDVEVQIEGIRLKFYYRQAQEKLQSIKDVFSDGNYDQVARIHTEVSALAQEMRKTNAAYEPVAKRVLEVSARWAQRATIRREFEGMRPKIQGIIMAPDGNRTVLNDAVVEEGGYLEELRVVRIENNKVTFRYKGEEIPVVFRRY